MKIDIQVDEAEKLYGVQLQFEFNIKGIKKELDQIRKFYPAEVSNRVEELMRIQIRKYGYLIKFYI